MTKLKNLEKAAERIRQAVQNKERIIIYGDSDMDGISSTVILQEAIKTLGGEVFDTMFPDRENDGYGVNKKALELLKGKAPQTGDPAKRGLGASRALFITLDLGIGNIKEVEVLNEMGFEVIIVDHHEILERIPNAKIVIDPKQEGDDSELTYLANVGVTFKLCEELLGDNFSENLKNSFLELVALATISDMVPQIGDNKIFIEKGLRSLGSTFRPALRAFVDIFGEGEVAVGGSSRIISSLNAAESKDFKNESYELLINSDPQECKDGAEKLIAKVQHKQMKIKQAAEEVERRISQKSAEAVIFEGDPAWKLTLAGPIASIIAGKYQKPTFIDKKGDTESCGSVRSLNEGENSVDAMKTCADFLITYGGHAKASGFRLKNEDLEKFKDCLNKYFKK